MSTERPFHALGACLVIEAETTSAAALLPTEAGPQYKNATVRVFNGSASMAFIKTGRDGTIVATASDTFLAPGSTEVFVLPAHHTYVAAILEAGEGPIYFQRGGGM